MFVKLVTDFFKANSLWTHLPIQSLAFTLNLSKTACGCRKAQLQIGVLHVSFSILEIMQNHNGLYSKNKSVKKHQPCFFFFNFRLNFFFMQARAGWCFVVLKKTVLNYTKVVFVTHLRRGMFKEGKFQFPFLRDSSSNNSFTTLRSYLIFLLVFPINHL